MAAISIILPVYNGIKYLEKSVDSVIGQEYKDLEFLIIDDCSNDGSWEYLQTLKDNRIRLFRNEKNKGLFFNLNFLIKKSDSPLIKLWSQDDILYSNYVGRIITFHNAHPEIGFSYTGRDYINDEGTLIPIVKIDRTPEIVSSKLHASIAFFTGSIAGNIANVTISRKALKAVGLFNENMKISGDFEMWVRLAKDHPIGFISEKLVQLRNHKGQLSGQEQYFINHLIEDIYAYQILFSYINDEQKKEGRQLLRNYKLLFYYTLMVKAFYKGRIKTGARFLKTLYKFDNIILLSLYFVRNRVLFRKKYSEFHTNNSEFIYSRT